MTVVLDTVEEARDYLRDTAHNLRETVGAFERQPHSLSSIETLLARIRHFCAEMEQTADPVIQLRPTGTEA